MEPIITVRSVGKSYGTGPQRAIILRGVSMDVGRGEVVYLVGPSGSGKTTLLSILGCILTPDAGAVEMFGREVSALNPDAVLAFRRANLGFIFQSFNLFPTLSALDNVRLALAMRDVPLRKAAVRSTELLGQVGLSGRAHLRPGQLSTGECQRVAIARALANDPVVVFADEPTASLDAANGLAVMNLLTGLVRSRSMTLVVVTHDTRIYPFADRILHLELGLLQRDIRTSPRQEPLQTEQVA